MGSLLRLLSGARVQRLLNKFTENDFEKVDRLIELYLKFQKMLTVRFITHSAHES